MSKSFTKSHLIKRLSRILDCLTEKEAGQAVDTVLRTIAASLGHGTRVEIRNFGVFDLRYLSARDGRNPKNGETVYIPGKFLPKFRAGKGLNRELNSRKEA